MLAATLAVACRVFAVAAVLLGMRSTRMRLGTRFRRTIGADRRIQTRWLRWLEAFNRDDRKILLQELADVAQLAFFRPAHQ